MLLKRLFQQHKIANDIKQSISFQTYIWRTKNKDLRDRGLIYIGTSVNY